MARSVLDLWTCNDRGEPVISGIPLVTGADLLAQYACMGLGF
ncbi:bacteriophage protein [Escherichia coli]|uniref:Bacteriophage protein n=1 Tax=Escherichia coli TaxID=562 RepID=A0A2X1MP36_ECOLX|nr:bacteriophage protein [Escherichia coli]